MPPIRLIVALLLSICFLIASAAFPTLKKWTWETGWFRFESPRPRPTVSYAPPPIALPMAPSGLVALPGPVYPQSHPHVESRRAGSENPVLVTFTMQSTLGGPDSPITATAKVSVFTDQVGELEDPYLLTRSVVRFWKSPAIPELMGIAKHAEESRGERRWTAPIAVTDVTGVYELSGRRDGWPWIQEENPCGGICPEDAKIAGRQFRSVRITLPANIESWDLMLIVGEGARNSGGRPGALFIKKIPKHEKNLWALVDVSSFDASKVRQEDIDAILKLMGEGVCRFNGTPETVALPHLSCAR